MTRKALGAFAIYFVISLHLLNIRRRLPSASSRDRTGRDVIPLVLPPQDFVIKFNPRNVHLSMLLQLRSLSFSTAGWLLSSSRCCWLLKVQVLNCKETEVAAAATYYNLMLYLMLSSVSGSPTSGGYYEAGTRRGEHHQEPFQLYSILSSPSWSF